MIPLDGCGATVCPATGQIEVVCALSAYVTLANVFLKVESERVNLPEDMKRKGVIQSSLGMHQREIQELTYI